MQLILSVVIINVMGPKQKSVWQRSWIPDEVKCLQQFLASAATKYDNELLQEEASRADVQLFSWKPALNNQPPSFYPLADDEISRVSQALQSLPTWPEHNAKRPVHDFRVSLSFLISRLSEVLEYCAFRSMLHLPAYLRFSQPH